MLNRFRHAPGAFAPAAVVLAMLLGGSGSLVPFPEMVLQCLLAGLTVAWIWASPDGLRQVPRAAWSICALMLAVPLLQMLPLPPILWQNLPGRAVEKAALALVGQAGSWRPLSLTPNRTLASLLVMIAAAAVLIISSAQSRRGRTIMLAMMAGVALLSVLFGAAQHSGGAGNGFRFYNPDEPFLDGFQTNHNAEADVLLIGMVALAASTSDWARRCKPAFDRRCLLGMVCGASLLLLLGVVLTASRTGIALLPIALGAQGLILRRWLPLGKRRLAVWVIAVLAMVGVVAEAVGRHGALGQVWGRFHTPTEFRPEIWRDSLFALRQYAPWGAGMGSFIPVFAAAERLEVVTGHFVNRAHDDYLEFLIEAGLPGLFGFGLIAKLIVKNARRGWRDPEAEAQCLFGVVSLIILAVHSLGDYPLRTLSIACMAMVSMALLLPIAERVRPDIGKAR